MAVNDFFINQQTYHLHSLKKNQNTFSIALSKNSKQLNAEVIIHKWCSSAKILFFEHDGIAYNVKLSQDFNHLTLLPSGKKFSYTPNSADNKNQLSQEKSLAIQSPHDETIITSPLAGGVIALLVSEGQLIKKGKPLLIIESMKMENEIRAPETGIIKTLSISKGIVVQPNQVLVTMIMKGDSHATTKNEYGEKEVPHR